jgi:type II secretory pathway pseudopilin PulG
MRLRGQDGEHGYAMAALLVGLAVMAVLMSAALPAWRHQARREKEAELAFRGEQYVRAIQLYQAKMGPGMFPPSFDVLVQQKFLRKKYQDPMSPDGEFMPRYAGVNPMPGPANQPGPGANRGQAPQLGVGSQMSRGGGTGSSMIPGQMGGGRGNQPGGIIGVYSKSREASIMVYRGATHYNEWQFVFAGIRNQPGGGMGVGPDGRGRGGQQFPGQQFPGGGTGIGGPGRGGRGGRGGFPAPDGRGGSGSGGRGMTPIIRPPGQ